MKRITPLQISIAAALGLELLIVTWVEILNVLAGSPLPRTDDCADGKWRVLFTGQWNPDAALREFVHSWGLLAYPLGAVTSFITAALALGGPKDQRRFAITMLIVAIGLTALVLYRGYWSSRCD